MASYHSEDWLLQKLNKDPTADLSGIQSLASLFVDVLSPDSMEVLVSCLRSLRVSSITPQQLVHDWQEHCISIDEGKFYNTSIHAPSPARQPTKQQSQSLLANNGRKFPPPQSSCWATKPSQTQPAESQPATQAILVPAQPQQSQVSRIRTKKKKKVSTEQSATQRPTSVLYSPKSACIQLLSLFEDKLISDKQAALELNRLLRQDFVEPEVNVRMGPKGATLLLCASSTGKLDCCSGLLQRGAKVNATDNSENTALHLVAKSNPPNAAAITDILLARGANPHKVNLCRESSLFLAVKWSSTTVLPAINMFLLQYPELADTKVEDLRASVSLACETGNSAYLQALHRLLSLQWKEVWTSVNGSDSPLHIGNFFISYRQLIVQAVYNSHSNVVQVLIGILNETGGAAAINFLDSMGHTPLGTACHIGNLEIVSLLTDANADVNMGYYESPLHVACRKGFIKVVEALLAHKANPTLKNRSEPKQYDFGELHGDSPLHIAAREGHLECVRALLLECPSATLQANKWGNIPLHVACLSNYVLVAKTILDSTLVGEENTSQQINWRNSKDDTPLHYAYRHNTRDVDAIVSLLILKGADVNSQNFAGKKPHETVWDQNDAQSRKEQAHAHNIQQMRELLTQEQQKLQSQIEKQKNEIADQKRDALEKYKICMEQPKDSLFMPCRHLACCFACAQALQRLGQGCPICREKIAGIERVFLV